MSKKQFSKAEPCSKESAGSMEYIFDIHDANKHKYSIYQLFIIFIPLIILFLTPFFLVPFSTMGDQPHYLLSASALLEDSTFNVRKTYEKMLHGGEQAGYLFKGAGGPGFDHHTVIVNTNSFPPVEVVAWAKYYLPDGKVSPSGKVLEVPENYAEYSIRPPGWPIVIATITAITKLKVEFTSLILSHIAVIVMAICIFLYLKKIGCENEVSFVSAITILIGSCYWIYANTAFADAFMGALIALVIYSLRFRKLWIFAISLSLGIWIKYQFVFYVLGFLLISPIRFSFKDIIKIVLVLIGSTIAFMLFHYRVYGHFGPVTATAVESGDIFEQLNYAFLNPSTSILLRNPWTYSLVGLLYIPFTEKIKETALFSKELRFLSVVFLVLIIPVMFYGLAYYPLGWGWPGRTVMPILIVLAIAFGLLLKSSNLLVCLICLALLGASIFIHLIAGFSDLNQVHHYDWVWLSFFFQKIFH
jgi:hypothetical protein